MNHLREERLEILFRYLGNGDLDTAKVWFFGIEEAELWNEETIKEIYKFRGTYGVVDTGYISGKAKEYGRKFTKTYDIMSKIILGLKKEPWEDKEWKAYRDEKLFTKGSDAFQGNLYPLGKKGIDTWPADYKHLFGLDRSDYYELMLKERTGRFAVIRQTRKTYCEPLIICFGSSFWSEFISCFDLGNMPFNDQDLFRVYSEEKMILTPFFGYRGKSGMTKRRIENLIGIINKLGINPFH